MAKEKFENHRLRTLVWIIRQLQRKPMSLSELNDLWRDDDALYNKKDIERRTFLNYKKAIADIFGIDIDCNRADEFKYRITSRTNPAAEQMMASFEMGIALERARGLGDTLLLEKIPRGQEYLDDILEAIHKSHKLEFTFQDFNSDGSFTLTGDPYALKCYQQRWYLVFRDDEEGIIDTYCLDRITELHLLAEKFQKDPDFNAKEYFRYCFGVRVVPDGEPQTIKLRVDKVQCDYLRQLPLHESQQEIETHRDYSIFELNVIPTVELTMKILSYGWLVEVLEPAELREVIKEEIKKTYKMYF